MTVRTCSECMRWITAATVYNDLPVRQCRGIYVTADSLACEHFVGDSAPDPTTRELLAVYHHLEYGVRLLGYLQKHGENEYANLIAEIDRVKRMVLSACAELKRKE